MKCLSLLVSCVIILCQLSGQAFGESDPGAEIATLRASLEQALQQVELSKAQGVKANAARAQAEVASQQVAAAQADATLSKQQAVAAESRASALAGEAASLRTAMATADSQRTQQIATLQSQLAASSAEAAALKETEKAAQKTQSSSMDNLAEIAALKQANAQAEADLVTAQQTAKTAAEAAKAQLDTTMSQLRESEKASSQIQQELRAEKARNAADKAALAEAKASAKSAERQLAEADAKIATAQAKAAETQTLADNLLAQHYEAWMPHWVAERYERRVRPLAISAYEASRQGAFAMHRSSSDMWDSVSPRVKPYVNSVSESVGRAVKHPHLAAARERVNKVLNVVLQSKGVRVVWENCAKVHAELEGVAGQLFKKHPLLAPLGEASVVGWVVTLLLSLPVLILLLFGRRKPVRAPAEDTFSGMHSSGGGGVGARNNKSRKGRRISVGADTVSFA